MPRRIFRRLEKQQGSTMQFRPSRQSISTCSLTTQHRTAHPSGSCLALFLSLMLLAGLTGCGPASSDNPPNPASRVSVSETPISKQSPSARHDSFASLPQTAGPAPIGSGDEAGSTSGKMPVPVGDSPQAVSASASNRTAVLEPLVVPAWIAKDLESPDIGTRLRALDKWVQIAPQGADDPLILALDNKDERVRARAMELIEQNWARAADAEQ